MKKNSYPTAKVFSNGAYFGVKVYLDACNNYLKKFDSKGDALRYIDDLIRYDQIKDYRYCIESASPTWGG